MRKKGCALLLALILVARMGGALGVEPLEPCRFSVPTNGLILHYAFDTEEGRRVTDKSGRGNHGERLGTHWEPSGIFSGACGFDGKRDAIVMPACQPRAQGTISLWAKWDVAGGRMGPLLVDDGAGYLVVSLNHDYERGDRLCFSTYEHNDPHWIRSSCVIRPGQWYHVAAVWDAQGTNRLYLDGRLVAQGPGHQPEKTDTPLKLGKWTGGYFCGTLDEVRLYARALTPEEIVTLSLPVVSGTEGLTVSEDEIVPLVRQLGAADSPTRRAAMRRLKALGRRAWPILLRYRDDPDPEIRLSVRELLQP